MRENRQSGSEGGGTETNRFSLPLCEDGQWVLKVFSLNQDLGFTDFVVQDFAIGRSQGLQIVQSHTAWRR